MRPLRMISCTQIVNSVYLAQEAGQLRRICRVARKSGKRSDVPPHNDAVDAAISLAHRGLLYIAIFHARKKPTDDVGEWR